MKLTKRKLATIACFVTSLFWGTGFIGMKLCIDMNLPANYIVFGRGLFASILLFIVFFKRITRMNRECFIIGLICGLLNYLGYLFQTMGLELTTPSNNAFLTSCTVIITPFLVWIFQKVKPKPKTYIAVLCGFVGMTFLTGFFGQNITFNLGDIYTMICALFFAIQIVIISLKADVMDVACIAFMMSALMAVGAGFQTAIFSPQDFLVPITVESLLTLAYLGILCTGLGMLMQTFGLAHAPATTCTLIFSMESVFACVFSVILGYDALSISLVVGGLLIMSSIIIIENDMRLPRLFKRTVEIKPRDCPEPIE